MASTKQVKGKSTKGRSAKLPARGASKAKSSGNAPSGISKRKQKSLVLAKPGGAQKTKSLSSNTSLSAKKKRRVYTEAELDIPKLNSIVPAGVAKPKGQKKGKKFVDDPVSMMAIMSVVNAEKEGHIESRIMRARQLEEIREAKRKEAESRKEEKERAFEERKSGLKKKRRKSASEGGEEKQNDGDREVKKGKRKRVSFA